LSLLLYECKKIPEIRKAGQCRIFPT
jgi:hypothetical protein